MGVEAEINEADHANTWSLRGASDTARGDNGRDRVTSLHAQPQRSSGETGMAGRDGPPPTRRDWAATLALVEEAAEAIRSSEQRIEELRREADDQARQHHADLTALHGQLLAAQREIEAAHHRARAAETRAAEANEWLVRLDDAISTHLGNLGRSS